MTSTTAQTTGPQATEQATAKLCFQLKERHAVSEALLEHECDLPVLIGNQKTPSCCMFWWGCPCRKQLTKLCHYLPEVPSLTKANTNMANPMQNKWVCGECYTCEPNPHWEPLQLKEFREMQATFTLSWPMLPAMARAGTSSVEPAACSRVGMQSVSASPGAVAPGAACMRACTTCCPAPVSMWPAFATRLCQIDGIASCA